MKISSIKSNPGIFSKSHIKTGNHLVSYSNKDVFEKQISFGNEENAPVRDEFEEAFQRLFQSIEHEEQEIYYQTYFELLGQTNFVNLLKQFRRHPVGMINNVLARETKYFDAKKTNEILNNAGIKTVYDLSSFLTAFNKPETKKIFYGQALEALEIYSKLKTKDSIIKYPELLLYWYNQSKMSEDNDFEPSERVEFLKKIGLKDEKEFDEKFKVIKPKFNYFETITDKAEAIKYVKETYPRKIQFIQDAEKKSEIQHKKTSAESLYSSHNDIIDRLYELNDGESLYPLDNFYDSFLSLDKLKTSSLNAAAPVFNNFKTPDSYICLLEFLSENDITPDDFNSVSRNKVISDNDIIDSLLKTSVVPDEISRVTSTGKTDSKNLFVKFSDLYSAIYSEAENSSSSIRVLTRTLNDFNIKNSNDYLSLYNRVNSTKVKKISKEEFKQFNDLMTFSPGLKLFDIAKSKNLTPVEYLQSEKEKYLLIENDIKSYIESDDSDYFIGMTPEELYCEYSSVLSSDGESVQKTLSEISSFGVSTSEEYAEKSKKIKSLEKYFPDRDTLRNFLIRNDIKFDSSENDDKLIRNIADILNVAESDKSVGDYYINGDFISKSKNRLDKFVQSYKGDTLQRELIHFFAKRKVNSVEDFIEFTKKYGLSRDKVKDFIKSFDNASENTDFYTFRNSVDKLIGQLAESGLEPELRFINFKNINPDEIISILSVDETNAASVIGKLTGAKDNELFVTRLPEGLTSKQKYYGRFDIAHEISSNADKSPESYRNIINMFGLKKSALGIKRYCSEYVYAGKIEDKIPEDLLKFIRSDAWVNYDEKGERYPDLTLHAKMRIIDRFAIPYCTTEKDLYSDDTKNYLKDIIRSIYTKQPSVTRSSSMEGRIVTETDTDYGRIRTIFSQTGKLISIMPKR